MDIQVYEFKFLLVFQYFKGDNTFLAMACH